MHKSLPGNHISSHINAFTSLAFALVGLFIALSACATSVGVFSGGDWQAAGLQGKNVRALTVDPNAPQKIYAGTAQGDVFVSPDATQNWTEHSVGLPLPDAIIDLEFDGPGKRLYAATEKGLFVSDDAAQHWQSLNTATSGLPSDQYTTLAFDLHATTVIYAGTAAHGVFKSSDNGITWKAINTDLPQGIAINSLVYDTDQQHLWAATSLGVYRSDDKGLSWKSLSKGLPANSVVNAIEPASIVGGAQNLVYAGTNHGFFLSENAGAQWAAGREALSGTSIRHILIDFRGASSNTTLYVATDAGAFRSDDSGQTWGSIATGLPRGEPVYSVILGADNYSQLLVATNDVYLFPGASGGFSLTRIIPIVLIGLLFYLLYRFSARKRALRSKPDRIIEPRAPKAET
ncbi:MAG TPA: hypothetical protein VKY19_17905 [Ktedonosporobacter sp.]|jgi:ligand-binding sensor domain-containing protein|nr:hypothetical protein [Ktedonosporobacter sp.]